jgi:5-methylcytosine-specific restriction endonuclease McrA
MRFKKTCSIGGCSGPCHGRGMCNLHYRRWRRTGTPHKRTFSITCIVCWKTFEHIPHNHPQKVCSDECRSVLKRKSYARYRAANSEKRAAYERTRPRRDYQPYREANRALINSRAKAWRDANPERTRDSLRRYVQNHPDRINARNARRRALKRGATVIRFTAEQLKQRLSMYPGCWMCGGPKEDVDHVKPLTKGGPHMLANLRPACRVCNNDKRNKWPLLIRERT